MNNTYVPVDSPDKQRRCGRLTKVQLGLLISIPFLLIILSLYFTGVLFKHHDHSLNSNLTADDLLSCNNLDTHGQQSTVTTYSFDPNLTSSLILSVLGPGVTSGQIKIYQGIIDSNTIANKLANITIRLVSTNPTVQLNVIQSSEFTIQILNNGTSTATVTSSTVNTNLTAGSGCARFDIEINLPLMLTMEMWNVSAPGSEVDVVATFVNNNGTGQVVITGGLVVETYAGDVTINGITAPMVQLTTNNGTIQGIFYDVRNFIASTQNGNLNFNVRGNYVQPANFSASTGNGSAIVNLQPISGASALGINALFDLSTFWAYGASSVPMVVLTQDGSRYAAIRLTTNVTGHMTGSITPIVGVVFPYPQIATVMSLFNISAARGSAQLVVGG